MITYSEKDRIMMKPATIYIATLLLLFLAPPANAQTEPASANPAAATSGTEPSAPGQTAVVVDEEAGVIRFLIDGEPVAMLSKEGLTVAGEVRYSGILTDSGAEFVRDIVKAGGREAAILKRKKEKADAQ